MKESAIMEACTGGKSVLGIKRNNEKIQALDINTQNLILTPLTCASLINEMLRCLVYEKSLIPYPFNWLKNVIAMSKKDISESEQKNVYAERQFRQAAAAFDAIEDITSNIKKLFKFGNNIKEILVLLGPTPFNPKEIYKFQIPKLAKGHTESNHYNMISKHQHKVLRSVVMSEEWMSIMELPLPLTNLFVFLNTDDDRGFIIDNRTLECFLPSPSYSLSKSAHMLTINLLYDDKVSHNCCSHLTVYEDQMYESIVEEKYLEDNEKEIVDKVTEEIFELNVDWLQANSVLKGFKECFANNKSKSQLS